MKSAFDWRIDFDEWSALATCDPHQFEQRRSHLLNEVLQYTAPPRQQRLRCLQWRIDKVREISPNPMSACIKLSTMMWDSLMGQGGLHETLHALTQTNTPSTQPARRKAVILPFRRVYLVGHPRD